MFDKKNKSFVRFVVVTGGVVLMLFVVLLVVSSGRKKEVKVREEVRQEMKFDVETLSCMNIGEMVVLKNINNSEAVWQTSLPRAAVDTVGEVEVGLRNQTGSRDDEFSYEAEVWGLEGEVWVASGEVVGVDWSNLYFPRDFKKTEEMKVGVYTVIFKVGGEVVGCDGFAVEKLGTRGVNAVSLEAVLKGSLGDGTYYSGTGVYEKEELDLREALAKGREDEMGMVAGLSAIRRDLDLVGRLIEGVSY